VRGVGGQSVGAEVKMRRLWKIMGTGGLRGQRRFSREPASYVEAGQT